MLPNLHLLMGTAGTEWLARAAISRSKLPKSPYDVNSNPRVILGFPASFCRNPIDAGQWLQVTYQTYGP